MTDLTISASSVLPGSNASLGEKTAGEAIDAGEVVYHDSSAKTLKLADNDAGTTGAEIRKPVGIAVNSAAAGQPCKYVKEGDITLGSVLTAGTDYYLSGNAGKICPRADVAAGDDVVLLGLAKSATVLALDIQIPGVELPE